MLAVALAVTVAAVRWARTRNGALRGADGEEADTIPTAVLEELGVRPADAELTVVQFSTAFCGPCRATRARLQQLQATRPGLAYVDVDAESHLDAVRALDVRRTPTLLYLRRDGSLLGRSSGAPRAEELTALVDAHTGARDGWGG
ncbi:Thioredoxin [Geodermatophilus ruber]|uniref:Thioredoxin n=1 Tax=Geodermatophilus ruber TaxID=504800 RepID=A0A1I3YXJ8_9ACTN|nr:Thioredoxin [Geodermatophilus ruber]